MIIACVAFAAIKVTRHESKKILLTEAHTLSSELLNFSSSRAHLTQRKPGESFEAYQHRLLADDSETQSLYRTLYYSKVANVREKFAKRGLTDRDLDEFYKGPTHPLGIRDIGESLSHMTEALQSH